MKTSEQLLALLKFQKSVNYAAYTRDDHQGGYCIRGCIDKTFSNTADENSVVEYDLIKFLSPIAQDMLTEAGLPAQDKWFQDSTTSFNNLTNKTAVSNLIRRGIARALEMCD